MGRRRDELLERAGGLPVLRAGVERTLLATKAQGARVYDVDNVGYVDYLGGGGSAVVGYANQFVLDAVKKALSAGIPEGFHLPQEIELAETLETVLPWVGTWWFCRHQDEAVRHVLRWVRQTTDRDQVLVLTGSARLGVGLRSIERDGLTVREVQAWDADRIEAAVAGGAKKVAALVVDPLQTGVGLVPAPAGVLPRLAEACRDAGVLLVLDERISGFRICRGGGAEWAGVTPDLAVYGGALGGGFPIGVVAFRSGLERADHVPDGRMPIPHPASLAAADAVVSILKNDAVYERLEDRGRQLQEGIEALAERFSRPLQVNRVGSVLAVYASRTTVADVEAARTADEQAYRRFVSGLFEEGVILPQVAGRPAYVSAAHGAKDVDETLEACERVLLRLHHEDLP